MKNRRAFLLSMTSAVVALAVLAAPVIADELIGFISKVDVEGKKITVTTKNDGDKEVSVTEDTEVVTPKGSNKIDLEKFAKNVAKSVEKNKKGIRATVTHEGGKASKIEVAAKKKTN